MNHDYNYSQEKETEDRGDVIELDSNESRSPLSSRDVSPVREDGGRRRGGSLSRRSRRESVQKDPTRDRSCGGVRANRRGLMKIERSKSPSLLMDAGSVDLDTTGIPGTSGSQAADGVPAETARSFLAETQKEIARMVGEDNCPTMEWRERGPGRRPVPEEYCIKRLHEAKRQLVDKASELRQLLNAAAPADFSMNRREAELKAERELAHAPLDALADAALEAIGRVDMIAQKAGNLKGEHQGALNRAAATLKAALTNLVKRQTREERDEEVEDLRLVIANQEKELVALREAKAQHACLQDTVRELQFKLEFLEAEHERGKESQSRNPTRATKRRKMIIESFSSNSEGEECAKLLSPANRGGDKVQSQREEITTPMEMEEEVESSRDQVLELISREGMPAALRPPL